MDVQNKLDTFRPLFHPRIAIWEHKTHLDGQDLYLFFGITVILSDRVVRFPVWRTAETVLLDNTQIFYYDSTTDDPDQAHFFQVFGAHKLAIVLTMPAYASVPHSFDHSVRVYISP
jgi:hypothetical protein